MTVARATTASLRDDFLLSELSKEFRARMDAAVAAGVNFNSADDLTDKQREAVCMKFHKAVITNLENRFSDDVSSLTEVIKFKHLC